MELMPLECANEWQSGRVLLKDVRDYIRVDDYQSGTRRLIERSQRALTAQFVKESNELLGAFRIVLCVL